ncbi:hypothetical protein [Nonomuraea dietziae]|uniref:hypothetical protein n=1 Tax=Nonomuraea dietziae TaxID=65515 RepID=UPI0031D0A25A
MPERGQLLAVLIAHLAATPRASASFRRRHAAQPPAAHRGRAVRHPARPASGRIDLGLGRARHRSRHRERDAQGRRRTPSRGGLRPDRLLRRRGARRPAVLPLNAEPPAHLAAALQRLQRQLAGLLGLPSPSPTDFSAENTEPALDLYRSTFRPSRWLDRP